MKKSDPISRQSGWINKIPHPETISGFKILTSQIPDLSIRPNVFFVIFRQIATTIQNLIIVTLKNTRQKNVSLKVEQNSGLPCEEGFRYDENRNPELYHWL